MDYLAGYLDHLTFERGLSPLTRENYARDIRLLLSLADQQPLHDIQPSHIRRYIATLNSRSLEAKALHVCCLPGGVSLNS